MTIKSKKLGFRRKFDWRLNQDRMRSVRASKQEMRKCKSNDLAVTIVRKLLEDFDTLGRQVIHLQRNTMTVSRVYGMCDEDKCASLRRGDCWGLTDQSDQ